jgi:uncharacterized phage protein (TIGR01671 family)
MNKKELQKQNFLIKFRAYHKTEKRFYDVRALFDSGNVGVLEIDGETGEPYERVLEAKDIIIQQYIGVDDKNGKEIFEGDIIKLISIPKKLEWIGDVIRVGCEFVVACKDGISNPYKKWEIVGNIFENKDLL